MENSITRWRGARSSRGPGLASWPEDSRRVVYARCERGGFRGRRDLEQRILAKKGDIPLWMYRKRVGTPKAGEPSRPVLFFVHGSSVTSRVFDLNVPGHGEYSLMDEFARYGFDCWTMDHGITESAPTAVIP